MISFSPTSLNPYFSWQISAVIACVSTNTTKNRQTNLLVRQSEVPGQQHLAQRDFSPLIVGWTWFLALPDPLADVSPCATPTENIIFWPQCEYGCKRFKLLSINPSERVSGCQWSWECGSVISLSDVAFHFSSPYILIKILFCYQISAIWHRTQVPQPECGPWRNATCSSLKAGSWPCGDAGTWPTEFISVESRIVLRLRPCDFFPVQVCIRNL